ncbi:N-acetyltransferase [Shewanella schlegeliana]|uniref:N-acetyltransferase n=1 Tax=Shewanella schlegeliana TaxID=190308 RepID=A0ABS1T3P0_9GAMM|nr:GNAT family N-acetyltransferase [Shewanella schlegeliana]MBL4915418.1 N-acetyltransferase [Shewanella schlegeliana]MCL1110058.1 N-acetyltransferase [Shewanella schlegeliana]GIU25025.1 N-acetyltransferase [Shewanella schlegeliana]
MTEVIHLSDESRFVINIEGAQAVLAYEIYDGDSPNSHHCNFNNTYVPPQLRGKGLAEKLVRHGLKWAKAEGFEIEASCWYVQKFLSKA